MAPKDDLRRISAETTASRRAFVTFLAGDGDYVKGVVGLAKGLRRVRSAYPLVVAVLPDVPEHHRRKLRSEGCVVRQIDPIYPPENNTQFAWPQYVVNYSKLRIWQMEEYRKLVYLDADVQVYENVDDLFDSPDGYVYGVMDCSCDWHHEAMNYSVGYCQRSPERAPWPAEMGPPPPPYFNAGVLVFQPSRFVCATLLQTLRVAPVTPFAEQDLLNVYFKEVYSPLPSEYNLMVGLLWHHPEQVNLGKAKVIHYCALGSKPWRYTGEEKNMQREDIRMLVKKWWEIYDEGCEPPVSTVEEEMKEGLQRCGTRRSSLSGAML